MAEVPSTDPDKFEDPLSNYEPAEYGCELERSLAEDPVTAIQSRPYAEIQPDAPIRQAVHALNGLKISSLLVVDDNGSVVGIVTERDILEKVAPQYEQLADSPVSEVMTSDPHGLAQRMRQREQGG